MAPGRRESDKLWRRFWTRLIELPWSAILIAAGLGAGVTNTGEIKEAVTAVPEPVTDVPVDMPPDCNGEVLQALGEVRRDVKDGSQDCLGAIRELERRHIFIIPPKSKRP